VLSQNLFCRRKKELFAEGYIKKIENYLISKKILAKHDENYIPPEVKEALEIK
jgi:Cytochrome c-type biogenesis protein CcmE